MYNRRYLRIHYSVRRHSPDPAAVVAVYGGDGAVGEVHLLPHDLKDVAHGAAEGTVGVSEESMLEYLFQQVNICNSTGGRGGGE